MAQSLKKKDLQVAISGVKTKSATDTLLDKFTEMATERSKRMSDKEFKDAIAGSRKVINRVRASRGRRRETA
jgi:hypothetical protein